MKKRFLLPLLILVSLVSIACKNNLNNSNPSVPEGLVPVSFSEKTINSRTAFFMPDSITKDTIARYTLSGTFSDTNPYDYDSSYLQFTKDFTSYDELCSFTKGLVPGKWEFTLNAFFTGDSEPILQSIVQKEISANNTNVSFQLAPVTSEREGTLQINIGYPQGKVLGVKFTAKGYNADGVSATGETKKVELSATESKATANIQLKTGNYILFIDFYNGTACTDSQHMNSFSVMFAMQGGNTTKVETSYEKLNENYSVEFLANAPDGGGVSIKSDLLSAGKYIRQYSIYDNVILPGVSIFDNTTAKKFAGWNETSDATSGITGWTPGTKSGNLTLYAIWADKPVYTVTFDSQGGTAVTSQSVIEDTYATEPDPAPTKPGYGFAGWYTDSACSDGNEFDFATTSIPANMILYAKWESVYIINFLDSGKTIYSGVDFSETYATSTAALTGTVVLPETASFNVTGLTLTTEEESAVPVFNGWYYDSACEHAVINDATSGKPTLDLDTNASYLDNPAGTRKINVYAKWNYKIVYVDPENAAGDADSAKSGFKADNAVKSITEAKRLTCNDVNSDVIYVMSKISEDEDLGALSDTAPLVKRHSDFTTGTYILNIPSTTTVTSLHDVTIDGNASAIPLMSTGKITSFSNFNVCNFNSESIITINASSCSFIGCKFYNNTISNNLLNVYCNANSLTITKCTFESNYVEKKLIDADNGTQTIGGTNEDDRNYFKSNTGNYYFMLALKEKSLIQYCDFIENKQKATTAVTIAGGVSFSNCNIKGNEIYAVLHGNWQAPDNPSITNCVITGNTFKSRAFDLTYDEGGKQTFTIENCVITGNTDTQPSSALCSKQTIFKGNCDIDFVTYVSKDRPFIIDSTFKQTGTNKVLIYESPYIPGQKVLDFDYATQKDYFACMDEDFSIDENGCIKAKYAASGETDPFDVTKNYTFELSDEGLTLAGDVYTAKLGKELKFTSVDKDGNSVSCTNWKIIATYAGVDPVTVYSDAGEAIDVGITLSNGNNYYPGLYIFTVSATYLGSPIVKEFKVQITE